MLGKPTFICFILATCVLLGCNKKENTFTYLALGDSYTIGTAIGEKNSYATKIADRIQDSLPNSHVSLKIIAQNGWTTADLRQGILNEKPQGPFQLVTMLIGVNNQYQHLSKEEYHIEFLDLIQKAISLAANNKSNVIAFSIPDYGVCPAAVSNKNQIAQDINQFNAINKHICDSVGIKYIDITPISRQALGNQHLVAPDQLHFSGQMHDLWVEKFTEKSNLILPH